MDITVEKEKKIVHIPLQYYQEKVYVFASWYLPQTHLLCKKTQVQLALAIFSEIYCLDRKLYISATIYIAFGESRWSSLLHSIFPFTTFTTLLFTLVWKHPLSFPYTTLTSWMCNALRTWNDLHLARWSWKSWSIKDLVLNLGQCRWCTIKVSSGGVLCSFDALGSDWTRWKSHLSQLIPTWKANHAIAEAVRSALVNSGHEVSFHDLCQEGFDPILP